MADNVSSIIEQIFGSRFDPNTGSQESLFSGVAGSNSALGTSLQEIIRQAFGLADVENSRFDNASSFLQGEFDISNRGFDADNRKMDRLLFSGVSDRAGRGAASGLKQLRTSLGARGIDANSGAAAALAGQIALRQSNQLVGGARDITIDSLRRRDAQRQNRYRQAFGLAEFQNQSPSMLGLDALQDVTGAISGVRDQFLGSEQASKGRKAAKQNAVISGVGSLLGGLI